MSKDEGKEGRPTSVSIDQQRQRNPGQFIEVFAVGQGPLRAESKRISSFPKCEFYDDALKTLAHGRTHPYINGAINIQIAHTPCTLHYLFVLLFVYSFAFSLVYYPNSLSALRAQMPNELRIMA